MEYALSNSRCALISADLITSYSFQQRLINGAGGLGASAAATIAQESNQSENWRK
jgi:hypothetical protein